MLGEAGLEVEVMARLVTGKEAADAGPDLIAPIEVERTCAPRATEIRKNVMPARERITIC